MKRGWDAHVLGQAPQKFTDAITAVKTLRVRPSNPPDRGIILNQSLPPLPSLSISFLLSTPMPPSPNRSPNPPTSLACSKFESAHTGP